MKTINKNILLTLFFFAFTINTRFVPLENITSIAVTTFGKQIALEIERKLLSRAKFQKNKVLVDEKEATALLNYYFSLLKKQPSIQIQNAPRQLKQPLLTTPSKNLLPLEIVMRDVKNLFGSQRKAFVAIESKLLKQVEIDDAGNLFINETIVAQLINDELAKIRQAPKPLDIIPLQGSLRQLPLIQLNVNTQKANSCGFHAMYNLKAIQDLIETGQPLLSANVKEISRMYLDGYLIENGIKESDLIDLAWEDKPAELAKSADLKNFFLIQYYSKNSPEVKNGWLLPRPRFAYNGDKNAFYTEEQIKQSERDFVNSVKKNPITSCILGIPGHYTAFAVIHKPGHEPFIIYMNSISDDGVNSVVMQDGSGEAAVAKYLSNLIKTIK